MNLNRQSGAVRVNAAAWATSPGFESNDLGFNPRSDRWGGHVALQLSKPEPDSLTRYRSLTLAKSYSYNFDGDKQGDGVNANARARLRNYWDLGLNGSFRWRGYDDRQTRGGPSMTHGRVVERRALARQRRPQARAPAAWARWLFRNEYGSRQWEGEATVELRPSSALSLEVGPSLMQARRVAQWVTSFEDAGAAGGPGRPLPVLRLRAARGRADACGSAWIFSPRLSLQLYAQPLVSRGDYDGYKELERARSFDFLVYGPDQLAYDPASATYTVDPGRGGAGPLVVRRSRLQLQVAARQHRPALGVAARLGAVRGLDAGTRELREPERAAPRPQPRRAVRFAGEQYARGEGDVPGRRLSRRRPATSASCS